METCVSVIYVKNDIYQNLYTTVLFIQFVLVLYWKLFT